MDTLLAISTRRSIRKYKPDSIPQKNDRNHPQRWHQCSFGKKQPALRVLLL